MLSSEACRTPGQGGWSKEARGLSEDVGLAMEGRAELCGSHTCVGRSLHTCVGRSSHTCVGRSSQGYPDSCLSPTSREGAQACADSPVLLENLPPPSSYWRGPVSPPSGTLLGPCAGVCVGGGPQWEGRGRWPIGQVHPQGACHGLAEETSGLQQGEAEPSDEERPSHRCGCRALGAASGRRELSLQGRALGVQPGDSLQEQKGHGLGSPGLRLL